MPEVVADITSPVGSAALSYRVEHVVDVVLFHFRLRFRAERVNIAVAMPMTAASSESSDAASAPVNQREAGACDDYGKAGNC